ncbi:TPA: restriction endonuclease [Proteus mirabilis]|uniref:restriction endonuclease n=1 Tax=Klebsiella pneumoniae TaxID=573 RepID=UPI0009367495|nr:restriction endonuclease [Klebsiella pneumoniae]HBC6189594.1 restriction endonuclease [Proteus mirabilis]HDY2198196.1 restriction endonuclease [Escherichia coli]RNP36844.1 restriction endonuclease [Klebsiella pneumoniae]HBC9254598.1 restriction endonuclease [Proteus mirabilis]HEK1831404.1 restriction endonuclease [Proteus mirabilis]
MMPTNIKIICWIFFFTILIISFWYKNTTRQRRHKRKQKIAKTVLERLSGISEFSQKIAYLRKIDPFVFEELLLEAFERRGYQVIRNKKYTGDGGVDGKVIMHGETLLIQAKRYRGFISLQHVYDFESLCERNQCKGIFCHTGKTRPELLKNMNNSKRLILISGKKLIQLLTVKPE